MTTGETPAAADAVALRALQGDEPAALDRIMTRWQRPLFRFAYQYLQNHSDAQDLVIETFVRLYRNRARLRDDTVLPNWLFATLANLCCNQYRWRKRHPMVSLDAPAADGAGPGDWVADPADAEQEKAVAHDEALAALDAALVQLPHDQKVALLLHHYNRMSYEEIGAVARCAPRGVETRIYRAKLQLRASLARFLSDGSRRA